MNPLVIIPCGAAKRDYPCEAHEMYVGTYFRACLRWALSVTRPDRVLILSAKYGLLPLQQVIDPYDVTFGRDNSVTKDDVRRQATAMGLRAETDVLVAAGKRYVEVVKAVWPTAVNVVDGKGGMGHQISWLKREAAR
jgi:hypothetical protein